MCTEQQKLEKRLDEQYASGLKNVHYSLSPSAQGASMEEICKEINGIEDAIENGQTEVLDFKDSRRI